MAMKKDATTRKAPAVPAAPQAGKSDGRAGEQAAAPAAPVNPRTGQGRTAAPEQAPREEPQPRRDPQAKAALENKGNSPTTTSRRSPEEIARRAYALWQQRGAPHGTDQEDWLRAERELDGNSRH